MQIQKKIIALAIAAAFSAPAFAETSFYGILDGTVASVTADGEKSALLAMSGGMATSRVGLNATEDVGTGTKVLVNVEYAVDGETNQTYTATTTAPASATSQVSSLAARQQMLALAGDWGTLATGYLQTEGWKFGAKFDVVGGSLVSPLGNAGKGAGMLMGGVTAGARAQHALAYISPTMNGVTVGVNYSTAFANSGAYTTGNLGLANTATALVTTATEISVNYDQGPVAAAFVYASANPTSTGASNTTEWELGGTYDLTAAKLYATYQTQSGHVGAVSTGASYANKVYSLGVAVPVGNDTVAFSYAAAKIDETAYGANKGGNGYTLGYLHPMSKMTKLYAAYSKESSGTATSAFSVANNAVSTNLTAGGSSSLIAVGVNHKF